jgi:excinuclease ABC subunit A
VSSRNANTSKSSVKKSVRESGKSNSTEKSVRKNARNNSNNNSNSSSKTKTKTTSKNEPEVSWLVIRDAKEHNLKGINISFPIGAFSVVTGVSGSGKSSLVHDVIWKSLAKVLNRNTSESLAKVKSISGIEYLNKVISVNQQPIGQTPTSNPATYTGIFDLIRELFAKLPDSKLRGYSARRFSFNVPDGRCEKCEGAGQIKIEMHFLPDVWITCDACNGKRYDRQTLDVKYHGYSIADVLEMTCADAIKLFENVPRIRKTLQLLCDVGLDYLSLGQSAPTLSGGESQRIKLASELTRPDTGRTLYLLDEPTTGLHFDDMNKLLHVIHRLVDIGNTVIVIEHNLDIIKNADWIVDLGPEAGDNGGYLLFEGTPEELINSGIKSHTADALKPILQNGLYQERMTFDSASLDDLHNDNVSDKELGIDNKMPWEKNGMKWHTQDCLCRKGTPVKWDGKILSEIVNRIELSGQLASTDWNHKAVVEICSEKKSLGWFMRAITNDEWILRIKFKTGSGTFKRDSLIASLALRPFSEIDSIPIYNAEPRVKVQRNTIQWQEIELQLHSFEEIDRPQFYDFLDVAIQGLSRFTKPSEKKPADLMPWNVLGEKWHFIQRGLIGGDKLIWDTSMLTEIFNLLRETSQDIKIIWTNKSFVQFFCENRKNNLSNKLTDDLQKLPFATVHTKQVEFIQLDLYVEKNSITSEKIEKLEFENQEIESHKDYDIVKLNFKKENDIKKSALLKLLKEI